MTKQKISPALPSASVILAREGDEGPELLMVERHKQATFGAAFAFPGGVQNEADHEVSGFTSGINAEDANQRLGLEQGGLAFYSAAVRELFEEMGLLLARETDGTSLKKTHGLTQLRARFCSGELSWSGMFRHAGLLLAADKLHYISHWETPVIARHRFSTRFFLTRMPEGQQPKHDGRELVDARWLTPSGALELAKNGDLRVVFPTLRHLRFLSRFTSLEALQNWARDRWREGIVKIRPVQIEEAGKKRLVIPGDPGYPEGGG